MTRWMLHQAYTVSKVLIPFLGFVSLHVQYRVFPVSVAIRLSPGPALSVATLWSWVGLGILVCHSNLLFMLTYSHALSCPSTNSTFFQ